MATATDTGCMAVADMSADSDAPTDTTDEMVMVFLVHELVLQVPVVPENPEAYGYDDCVQMKAAFLT